MPTQHDFRAAATALRDLAMSAGFTAVSVYGVRDDVGTFGRVIDPIVDAGMNAAYLNARKVETESNTVADELARRAEVCADYTDAMRRWRNDVDAYDWAWSRYREAFTRDADVEPPTLVRPTEPSRWPLWVEEG